MTIFIDCDNISGIKCITININNNMNIEYVYYTYIDDSYLLNINLSYTYVNNLTKMYDLIDDETYIYIYEKIYIMYTYYIKPYFKYSFKYLIKYLHCNSIIKYNKIYTSDLCPNINIYMIKKLYNTAFRRCIIFI